MPDTILQKNITISSAQDTGVQIKLKDETSKTYSFFKNKKDGGVTQAFEQFGHYKLGDRTGISYKEVPYKDGMIKNIIGFMPLMQETVKPEAPQPVKEITSNIPPPPLSQQYFKEEPKDEKFWDRITYEKCCSIWAQGRIAAGETVHGIITTEIEKGNFWELFQAIRKDGEKRFSTGWDKAVKTFTEPLPEPPPEDIGF